jgi:hypothetical protein
MAQLLLAILALLGSGEVNHGVATYYDGPVDASLY